MTLDLRLTAIFPLSSSSDVAFDIEGYAFILLNDAFTAASNVYTKKNLGTEVTFHAQYVQIKGSCTLLYKSTFAQKQRSQRTEHWKNI